jgi:uncharacterized membrane protein
MADQTRERYLAELDSLLPMPPEQRGEILEEIAAHLEDAVAERLEQGVPPDVAEGTAQARLGRPIDLARDLARPEQSARRLFAGVGAAITSGIGHWIYGYLLGLLVIMLGALALTAIVQAVGVALDTGWTLQFSDQGWNSMLASLAGAVGLYWAGRVLADRFALRSGRLARDVRPWIVGVATAAVFAFNTLVVDTQQNWASVVALTVAPAAIILGAYRPNLLPGRTRFAAVVVVLLILVIGISGLTVATSQSSGDPEVIDQLPDRGLGIVGPEWHPGTDASWEPAFVSSSWGQSGDRVRWDAELAPGVSLSEFHGIRLEAWRVVDDHMRLDPAAREPFATAAVHRDGRAFSALIDTTNVPGVVHWDLILTGVGTDGVRYVLNAGSGGMSTFTGSVWDWLVAVIDGS